MYIEYLHHFHRLERSIQTNKVDDFTRAMTPIIALFFVTNHVNYSRWLSKFQLDLLNIDNTHPGLREILEQGAFSVRRTDHNFNRLPVDFTLEQTINADGASRQTGVSSMTNNYNARLCWMLTKAARASFIDKVNDLAAISDKEDVTSDLQSSRLRRKATDLQSMIDQILETCNPFQDLNSESLFNIHTGKAASDAVKQCLLNIPGNGKAYHKKFIEECTADAGRFEKPITRFKLVTFQNECARNMKAKDKKVAELRCTRDLMGRLTIIGMEKNIDFEYVFTYPLPPVPLSLFSPNLTMAKTNKNSLFQELEKRIMPSQPDTVDAAIIDGPFMLHLIAGKQTGTYSQLCRTVLSNAV